MCITLTEAISGFRGGSFKYSSALAQITAANTILFGSIKRPAHLSLPVVQLSQLPEIPIVNMMDKWLASKTEEQRRAIQALVEAQFKI